jgi:NADPH-dependent glutamate synthase beta subunit-like oxidoreductase
MPARAEEVHHARQEGIDFQMLTAPVEFVSDGKGWLTAVRCVRMELGEPDSSGRRQPVPIKGSEFDLPLSVAVMAIGTTANPIVQSTTPGLDTDKRGYIQADSETQRTTRRGGLRGGRHCDRSCHGDSRYGRRPPRGQFDSRLSDERPVVSCACPHLSSAACCALIFR